MTLDTETLATIDRIAPPAPAVPSTALPNAQRQLADAQARLDALSAAVRRADADITALQTEQGALRILQEQRSQATSAAYVRGKAADTRELDKAIAAVQSNISALRQKAEGAIAARVELIPQVVRQRGIVEDLQSSVIQLRAASGASMTPEAISAYARDYERRVAEQLNAGRQKLTSQEQQSQNEAAARNAASEERQRQGFMSRFLARLS